MSIFSGLSMSEIDDRLKEKGNIVSAALIAVNLVLCLPMLLNGRSLIPFPNQPDNFSIGYM